MSAWNGVEFNSNIDNPFEYGGLFCGYMEVMSHDKQIQTSFKYLMNYLIMM